MVWICLCNGITDTDVAKAACAGARRPKDIYAACGCRAQCGRCAKDILRVIQDTPSAPDAARASGWSAALRFGLRA